MTLSEKMSAGLEGCEKNKSSVLHDWLDCQDCLAIWAKELYGLEE